MATVRVRLKELLEERGMTQEELSKKIGVPQGTISRWAGNKVDRLDRGMIAAICEELQCEVGDLLALDRAKAEV